MCASGSWIFSWIFEFAEKQQAETAPERRHGRSKAARKKKAHDKEEEAVEEHTVWACREKLNRREKKCREPEDWNKPWTIACDSCRGWWRGVHAGFPVEQPEYNKSVAFVRTRDRGHPQDPRKINTHVDIMRILKLKISCMRQVTQTPPETVKI